MAGGTGERFWPLSTKAKPKQLLPLITGQSMIRETIDRVTKMVDINSIYIATNNIYAKAIQKELPELPIKNLIIEPAFKDTAAAIAYGSMLIQKDCLINPTIAVIASDHLINDVSNFLEMLALAAIEANNGFIVTLGIKPTKPETGYGYIKVDNKMIGIPANVIKFVEKPIFKVAESYINDGNYFWNSGMFVFKYETFLDELNKYMPNHFKIISNISLQINNKVSSKILKIAKPFFENFEKISIDFGLMEKSKIIKCIPVDFGWNDIGSFNSLDDIFQPDLNGNVIKDVKYIYVDSKNNIVISNVKNKIITTISVYNMIIVDTKDALLICDKKDGQRIKEILKLI
jgi:mannose-1-phosphate guanylyltransferase